MTADPRISRELRTRTGQFFLSNLFMSAFGSCISLRLGALSESYERARNHVLYSSAVLPSVSSPLVKISEIRG
jgi:hypothetical protein